MLETVVQGEPARTETEFPESRDRELLVHAATRVAVERGVRVVEPELVARTAGLPVAEFDRHFASVDQCILAGFDDYSKRMQENIDEACSEESEWTRKVRAAVIAAIEFASELEGASRLFVADAMRMGPAAVERQMALLDDAADHLRTGREHYPEAAELPKATERALIAGIVMLATSYLLGEEADQLVEVQIEAVEMLLSPYVGADRARAVAQGG